MEDKEKKEPEKLIMPLFDKIKFNESAEAIEPEIENHELESMLGKAVYLTPEDLKLEQQYIKEQLYDNNKYEKGDSNL